MGKRRVPRDTSRAMREDPAESGLFLTEGIITGSPTSFIEAQEAAGQREMVNSDVIPTDMRGEEDEFTKLGFVLGDILDGDPMFRHATLPPGWKREGSGHAMWSYLIDSDGFRRAEIFYKAAFYDRSAFIRLNSVYGYVGTCLYEKTTPQIRGGWATREAVLEAIAKHRDYHVEQVTFWTTHERPEHITDHESQVQLCDRLSEQITGAKS